MTGRYLSVADLTDPAGAHERRRRDDEVDLRRGEIELRAQIEGHRFRQDDAHHRDKLEQADRHHAEKMTALTRADDIDARRLDVLADRDRAQLELGRERLEFDREHAAMTAQTTRDTAMIQARTSLEITKMQQDGAITLSELGHRQSVALSELNHTQALDLAREQSHLASLDATAGITRETVLSTICRGEDATKHLNAAIGSILVEKARGRIAERLEDQKERHRTNERGHELTMTERAARFARVGFTRDELVRAGFSADEAALVVSRMIAGAEPQDESEAAVFAKFDDWYKHSRKKP